MPAPCEWPIILSRSAPAVFIRVCPASEYTTVFGGMIMSTVLNLFFIPVLYLIIEGWREHGKAPVHR